MFNKLFLNRKTIFLFGTIVAYLGLFFAHSFLFYVLAFIWFFFITCLYLLDIKKAIFLTAVFALPYSQGKSFLSIDNTSLLTINPFTICVLVLSILSIKDKLFQKIDRKDILLFLFFLYGIISYLLVNTSYAVLNGILRLGIYIIFYFLTKHYLLDEKLKRTCIYVLISIAIFESGVVMIQFLLGHPIGRFIEEGMKSFPYGRLSDEDNTLFRPSGTFAEPTYLARFLTILLPLVLVYVGKLWIPLIVLIAIFVSLTRFSWLTAILALVVFFCWRKRKFDLSYIPKPLLIIATVTLLSIGTILLPYFTYKIQVTPLAFQELGSFDFRIKLAKESFNLISQYPLFGVGLNRFSEFAAEANITGLYDVLDKGNVHNVFLRIASEMGILALIFFLGFILITYYSYFKMRKNIRINKLRMVKDVAAFGGLIYLLEASMGTIFLTPHFALFFLYMAIINT